MADRDNPLTVYVTDEEKQKLKKWANETGKSLSDLSREAIMEYLDYDRYDRLEGEVNDLHDKVDRILALVDGEHAHTRGQTASKSVPEKARSIVRIVREKHSMPVKDKDLELIIGNNAGSDDRTIDKYKRELKKRGLLYKHPFSEVWTDDQQEFVKWVEGATVGTDTYDIMEEYAMDIDEYDQIAQEVTQ